MTIAFDHLFMNQWSRSLYSTANLANWVFFELVVNICFENNNRQQHTCLNFSMGRLEQNEKNEQLSPNQKFPIVPTRLNFVFVASTKSCKTNIYCEMKSCSFNCQSINSDAILAHGRTLWATIWWPKDIIMRHYFYSAVLFIIPAMNHHVYTGLKQ